MKKMRWLPALASLAILGGCVTETAQFQPTRGQESIIRDGIPALVSEGRDTIVLVRPATRDFSASERPSFVLAIYNGAGRPITFTANGLSVVQNANTPAAASLHVYTYEELVQEERNRQMVAAIFVGLAAGANAAAAANSGYYNSTSTVYSGGTPIATINTTGYSPTARTLAQMNANAQNRAMVSDTIETGRRNMSALEQQIIKDNTIFPGEWYGGRFEFTAPTGEPPKSYRLYVQIGADTHAIDVIQGPPPGV